MTERPLEQTPRPLPTAPPFPTDPPPAVGETAEPPYDPAAPPLPTAPVPGPPPRRAASVQPRVSFVRMGPWAPVAGAVLGLVVGLVVVLVGLAPVDLSFAQRLASVFLCLGLALLGAGGVLFADEVRVRRRSVGAQSAEVVAGLLNGLTPARFLVGSAGFVLLLAAYVAR
ncbi:hypothetical protein [Modestobacter sp. Leaf380]|uniref:hypothetical protein n=1 Tax=Modestobacter sp. Leaf380 TaxID=1736356 RepID=UPI0007018253|nr:hypothetical protein [Modestobacter sp. Leaf380]KQS69360.1 hypothetical protein ASG41_21460 [Modestobacter sp. Leaf380]